MRNDPTSGHGQGRAPARGHDGAPPPVILSGFQVASARPVQLGEEWSYGWRCDRAVISPADDPARASWVAKAMAKIRPVGVAVSRPISSSDGRYSISGWRARTFLSGHRSPRFDEMAAAALRFNAALVDEQRPVFLGPSRSPQESNETSLFSIAEEAAFSDNPVDWIANALDPQDVPRSDVAQALERAAALSGLRDELYTDDQLVHGDIAGCLIFDGASDPIITDFYPAWRPAPWSVALLAVDTMSWGNAPDAIIERWAHLPDFEQLLVRAILYRLLVHAVLPTTQPEALPGLLRVADVIAARPPGNF